MTMKICRFLNYDIGMECWLIVFLTNFCIKETMFSIIMINNDFVEKL